MKCKRCGNFCEKLKREFKGKWIECWYCSDCLLIYTLVKRRCLKCGADSLFFFTRRLREGDRVSGGKIDFGSVYKPYVKRKKVKKIKNTVC